MDGVGPLVMFLCVSPNPAIDKRIALRALVPGESLRYISGTSILLELFPQHGQVEQRHFAKLRTDQLS